MEESALERYFDKYIADDAPHRDEEEQNEEKDEEEFIKLLPDELLTLMESRESSQDRSQRSEQSVRPPEETNRSSIPRSLDSKGQKLIPKINNVISTVDLCCHLDLNYIAANAWNVQYNEKRFLGLNMRIRKPRATGNIYSTGKLVCLGTESVEESRVAARRLARILQKLGFPVRFLKFKVHNITASCKTHPVNLELMANHRGCSYEPELFPALFYSVMPGMNVTVHRGGTLSFTV
ncbi:uncharacterized protein LOC141785496 [Halichoeres trimaculatus]|uniref:uncharacterized protein LOC141785496 n=1 Tax=Halichoeres trimaculatus TaxID=147232 RepID=UPI003D9E252D